MKAQRDIYATCSVKGLPHGVIKGVTCRMAQCLLLILLLVSFLTEILSVLWQEGRRRKKKRMKFDATEVASGLLACSHGHKPSTLLVLHDTGKQQQKSTVWQQLQSHIKGPFGKMLARMCRGWRSATELLERVKAFLSGWLYRRLKYFVNTIKVS